MNQITAPFTPEQVDALNHYQTGVKDVLPSPSFICPNRSEGVIYQGGQIDRRRATHGKEGGDFGVLIATQVGWVCPHCGYTQDWAHEFMAEPFSVNPGSGSDSDSNCRAVGEEGLAGAVSAVGPAKHFAGSRHQSFADDVSGGRVRGHVVEELVRLGQRVGLVAVDRLVAAMLLRSGRDAHGELLVRVGQVIAAYSRLRLSRIISADQTAEENEKSQRIWAASAVMLASLRIRRLALLGIVVRRGQRPQVDSTWHDFDLDKPQDNVQIHLLLQDTVRNPGHDGFGCDAWIEIWSLCHGRLLSTGGRATHWREIPPIADVRSDPLLQASISPDNARELAAQLTDLTRPHGKAMHNEIAVLEAGSRALMALAAEVEALRKNQ